MSVNGCGPVSALFDLRAHADVAIRRGGSDPVTTDEERSLRARCRNQRVGLRRQSRVGGQQSGCHRSTTHTAAQGPRYQPGRAPSQTTPGRPRPLRRSARAPYVRIGTVDHSFRCGPPAQRVGHAQQQERTGGYSKGPGSKSEAIGAHGYVEDRPRHNSDKSPQPVGVPPDIGQPGCVVEPGERDDWGQPRDQHREEASLRQ